jgi:hypothetical protein
MGVTLLVRYQVPSACQKGSRYWTTAPVFPFRASVRTTKGGHPCSERGEFQQALGNSSIPACDGL